MRDTAVIVVIAFGAALAWAGENWPQFRGPDANGYFDAAEVPLTWSETKNVAWKTAIHGRGWSSPVIWGDQVWMTTATDKGHEMFAVCVHRDTGKILHDVKLWDVEKPEKINPLNSYASPTPVVEPGRVYVTFGTYGTACLATDTLKVLWTRRDLRCDHSMGPGSSPVLIGRLLILTFDGMDVQFVIALDKTTGRTLWKTNRSVDFTGIDVESRKAFCTPTLIEVGGRRELITAGAQAAYGYDPETLREMWRVRYRGGYSNVARPTLAEGLLLINTGFDTARLLAVRPGGTGDVTATHVAWELTHEVPLKTSPAVVDGLVYLITDTGILTCLEAKTSQRVWRERIGGSYSASPVIAGRRIYFFDDKSTTTVIEPGRQYKVLGVNKLDGGCMASPALVGKAIFLRTKTHLYRIEE